LAVESDDLSVFRFIAEELKDSDTGPARAKFLAEAALVARTAASDSLPHGRVDAAVAAIERALRGYRHMALGDNSLRASDLLFPYAALHGRIPPIAFYETRLDEFVRRRTALADRPGYRTCEDEFIAYMAGRGKLPAFCEEHWPRFVRRAHDFSVEHCYWFTHRYLYASDMGSVSVDIDWVAPAMLLIVAKAARWGDPDLFYEAAFCVLCAKPLPEWVAAIDTWSEALLPNLLARASDNMSDVYHELFLYSLFKMRRDRVDLPPARNGCGSARALTDFVDALMSKSPDKIGACYFSARPICRHPLLAEICIEKLAWLKDTAQNGTLFENEIRRSEAEPAPELLEEYADRVDAALDVIRRSLLEPEPPPARRCTAAAVAG
jgi:hypothetical protein